MDAHLLLQYNVTALLNQTTKEVFMEKIYGIRVWQGSIVVKNGKLALYASRELSEQDLHSMPDSWTDYDHYELVELDVMCSPESLLFSKPNPGNV